MKNLWYAASVLLLAGLATAQTAAINSMSGSTTQNQVLTGATGHSFPPSPVLSAGVPDAGDRVSGTAANANTMYSETESMTPPAANSVAQQAIFESADQSSAHPSKPTQH